MGCSLEARSSFSGPERPHLPRRPAPQQHLYTREGKLRSFVNLYLNDEDVRYLPAKEDSPVAPTEFAEAHRFGCAYVITAIEKGAAKTTNSLLLTGTTEDTKAFISLSIDTR